MILESNGSISDICEHLDFLYESAKKYPEVCILELGVRDGNSTTAFIKAVEENAGKMISVDIMDCSGVCSSSYWKFVKCDDVEYEPPHLFHVIFIDTSHEYAHTLTELEKFSNFLTSDGIILMHDTMDKNVMDAIKKFMERHPEWSFENREFNNGLGTLKKRRGNDTKN